MGRSPCARSRSRCRRTLVRVGFGFDAGAMSSSNSRLHVTYHGLSVIASLWNISSEPEQRAQTLLHFHHCFGWNFPGIFDATGAPVEIANMVGQNDARDFTPDW